MVTKQVFISIISIQVVIIKLWSTEIGRGKHKHAGIIIYLQRIDTDRLNKVNL